MIPIRYVEPVYRPPSEAQSLILPVTDGCSWNQCTFCEMYQAPQKAFRARSENEVLDSLRRTGERYGSQIRRVFLADGDALVLPTRRLLTILEAIRRHLPAVHRVSSYCLARNLKKKSVAELIQLRETGLAMAYLGAESGEMLCEFFIICMQPKDSDKEPFQGVPFIIVLGLLLFLRQIVAPQGLAER